MPILAGLNMLILIAFAIHVVRTGRELYWIGILLIPVLGPAVYFFTQILPDLQHSRTAKNTGRRLLKVVDPERDLRERKDALDISDTVENRKKLAEEYIEAQRYDEAIALLKDCLDASNTKGEPDLLLLLAKAQFGSEHYSAAKKSLDQLIEENPDFKSPDGHLLYARSLEKLGLSAEALKEYEVLAVSYPGEEARLYYGLLLEHLGRKEEADKIFQEMLLRAKRSPKYYQKKEKKWLDMAKERLGQ